MRRIIHCRFHIYYKIICVALSILIHPDEAVLITKPLSNSTTRTNENFLTYEESSILLNKSKRLIDVFGPVKSDFLTNEEIEKGFQFTSASCKIPDWNTVRTESLPHEVLRKEWLKRSIGANSYLYGKTPGMLAAFAHKEEIVVTLTTENLFGRSVFCRYYDCKRREVLSDQFQSVVFPESTVSCPRRIGAKYIAVTRSISEKPEYPVPVVPRQREPEHYFTVCMAPLYGSEPKFLQIAEFIEYYKLQGATFFQVYIRNVSDYDRVLLDDYVRTGDVEVIKLHDHYWREDWLWHNPEINDCLHRNKYFSKWTALVDLDEHIEMKNDRFKKISDLLDSVKDPNIINLLFRVQWVIKDEPLPTRYVSDKQILEEMVSQKFHNSSVVANWWRQPKCIIRPERVAAMRIHSPAAFFKGVTKTVVDKKIGVVRHYRNMYDKVFRDGVGVMLNMAPFRNTDVAEWIKTDLAKAVVERVKWIYDIKGVSCRMKKWVYLIYGLINRKCAFSPSCKDVCNKPR